MIKNIERYKKDLEKLIVSGANLHNAMQHECLPEEFEKQAKKELGDKAKAFIKELPRFKTAYQAWYSESKALIRQLLPDRLDDFVRHYEKPKSRKDITFGNYSIEDYLQGINVTRGWDNEKVVGPEAAISRFEQQVAILVAVRERFESSLFDIRQLVQADLFDSELDAAHELLNHKFTRAAGAVAGVVLEKHLTQSCDSHNIKIGKKAPGISDLNDALKANGVVDTPQWRFIQHLGDIRNLCDHDKKTEPSAEQVKDLLDGVDKITKTLF